jgi:hypothetical protein
VPSPSEEVCSDQDVPDRVVEGVCTTAPPVPEPAWIVTLTVDESPAPLPAVPAIVGVFVNSVAPLAGLEMVTVGAAVLTVKVTAEDWPVWPAWSVWVATAV